MEQIIITAAWLILAAVLPVIPLCIIAWHDIKTRTIINWQLLLFAGSMLPLIAYHWVHAASLTNIIVSALYLIILAALYKLKKMPSGDVLLLIPIALAFGFPDCLWLIAVALIAHVIFSAILAKKQTGAKPFAPAVLIGYLFVVYPAFLLIPDLLAVLF